MRRSGDRVCVEAVRNEIIGLRPDGGVGARLHSSFFASLAFSPPRMIAAIWACVAALNLVLSYLGPHPGKDTLNILGSNFYGLCTALTLSSATQRLRLRKGKLALIALLMLVLIGGMSVWAVDATLQSWATYRQFLTVPPLRLFVSLRYNVVYYTLIFALQTAALAAVASSEELAARERQLSQAQLAEQQARLMALTLKLNPHFLFNALNALTTLVAEDRKEDTVQVLSRLSTFLRSSLSFEPGDYITLDNELETVQAYLDLETARFGVRLRVEYSCEPDLEAALVPPLILQPLVENAIKYAVSPSTLDVNISISAWKTDSKLFLVVRDSCAAPPSSAVQHGVGIGLANIAARLESCYGTEAELSTQSDSSGFTATISLPLCTLNEGHSS